MPDGPYSQLVRCKSGWVLYGLDSSPPASRALTAYQLLPTSRYLLLPTSYFLLPTSYLLLIATCCLLPDTCYLLPATCYLLASSRYLLLYLLLVKPALLLATCYLAHLARSAASCKTLLVRAAHGASEPWWQQCRHATCATLKFCEMSCLSCLHKAEMLRVWRSRGTGGGGGGCGSSSGDSGGIVGGSG